jgi:deoxyribodipyrimidine photolyase
MCLCLQVYKSAKGQHSKPPVSLLGQLLWREFFYLVRTHAPSHIHNNNSPCLPSLGGLTEALVL